MHSNFITPPDFIKTILIVDASEDELMAVSDACKLADTSYDIYLYNEGMNNLNWLANVVKRSDIILQKYGSAVPILEKTWFGPERELKTPAEYFNK